MPRLIISLSCFTFLTIGFPLSRKDHYLQAKGVSSQFIPIHQPSFTTSSFSEIFSLTSSNRTLSPTPPIDSPDGDDNVTVDTEDNSNTTETEAPTPYQQEDSLLPDISGEVENIDCSRCPLRPPRSDVQEREADHFLKNDAEVVNTSLSSQLTWRNSENRRVHHATYNYSPATPTMSGNYSLNNRSRGRRRYSKIQTSRSSTSTFASLLNSARTNTHPTQIASMSAYSVFSAIPLPTLADTCMNTTRVQGECKFHYEICINANYHDNNNNYICNVTELKSGVKGSSGGRSGDTAADEVVTTATVDVYEKLTRKGSEACNVEKALDTLEPDCVLNVSTGFFFMNADDLRNGKAYYHTIVTDNRTGIAGSGDNPQLLASYAEALADLKKKQPMSFCPARAMLRREVTSTLRRYDDVKKFRIGNALALGDQISATLRRNTKLSQLLTEANQMYRKLLAPSHIPSSSPPPVEDWKALLTRLKKMKQVYDDRLALLSKALLPPTV